MKREIIIDVSGTLTRVALREDGDIHELYVEGENDTPLVGSVFKGKVQNILPGMQAAFIDIGLNKNAFLYAGDLLADKADFEGVDEQHVEKSMREQPSIKKLLRVGQELLVQVIKEPGGTKGPRVTTHITIPGRSCVLVPSLDYVGVSRRIESDNERAFLKAEIEKAKPSGMGVIVRTAARGMSQADFKREISALVSVYSSILEKAKYEKAPSKIYSDQSLAYRVVRDMLTGDIDRLIINDRMTYESAKGIAGAFSPELASKVEHYSSEIPVFDAFDIEKKVRSAIERKVWLKNGGYIVIDQTEALTVIDVNTGRFVGTTNLQNTVYSMNMDAAKEIARQIRLRDISGIIIIDFIDMLQESDRRDVLEELRKAFANDRTKTNIIGLTGLGLVEMTRKKLRQSLSGITQCLCPLCHGEGRVLKPEFIVNSAIRDVQRMRAGSYICDLLIEVGEHDLPVCRQIRNLPGVYCKLNSGLGCEQYRVVSVHDPDQLNGAFPMF